MTVTLADQFGYPLAPSDLARLNLYAYGPQETTKTVTAVKLLNATADRTQSTHHYVNLLTNADAKTSGNTITYDLKPVSDEAPGTYTATAWAVLKADGLQQTMEIADFQVGTATVEAQTVEKSKCAACHEGASSGKVYLHHVDPRQAGQSGNWALDFIPVRTCKSCHNNEGYAAYRGDVNDPSAGTSVRTPDPIVRRVHGVHMGEGLKNAFNNTPETGNFADYVSVVFPADVKNCTKCHVDDRWKTEPSRLACGACHDNVWFGAAAAMPEGREAHPGGPQADDSGCATCHTPDAPGFAPIAVAHEVAPPAFKNVVALTLTPPANGKFYVAGEKPEVTITIKDAATGAVIDPATIVEPADATKVQPNEWRRANFYVSGPRDHTLPVLTTAAEDADPTHSYANNDFRVRVDPANEDPRIARTATSIVYQLDDVAALEAGTYTAFVETMPAAPIGGWAFLNFQVGAATPEAKVATNCTTCHADTRMHASYFAVNFDPDICKNCHDYQRQMEGRSGWNDRNNGYGAAPLSRRVHGVHFGAYLDKPEEVHGVADAEWAAGIIFPQDVRNCTKCHSESDMWTTEPARVACLACHDSDEAILHASLQTLDPTPAEPYSGDEQETCTVCHGKGKEFTPSIVHSISNPYKPPYPREPAE